MRDVLVALITGALQPFTFSAGGSFNAAVGTGSALLGMAAGQQREEDN